MHSDAALVRTLDDLGGREAVSAVVRRFYDKVYVHPLLGPLFARVDRRRQELRLAGFLAMSTGDDGMTDIHGRYLREAHAHLPLTDELVAARRALLCEAVVEEGLPAAALRAWVAVGERWGRFVLPRREHTP